METGRSGKPGAGVIIKSAGAGEDDEADFGVAQDGELLGLLHQTIPPLGEGHLPAGGVVDPLDHDLPSHHVSQAISSRICPHKLADNQFRRGCHEREKTCGQERLQQI